VYFGLPVRLQGLRGREGFQAGKECSRGWLARRAHRRAVLGRPHPRSPRYSRQTKTVLRRWSDAKGKLYTDYLISTLTDLTAEQIAKHLPTTVSW